MSSMAPPRQAMISAMVFSPDEIFAAEMLVGSEALKRANPSGSRVVSRAGRRCRDLDPMRNSGSGLTASAQSSASTPTRSVSRRDTRPSGRAQAAKASLHPCDAMCWPWTGLLCQRCCQVSPGKVISQSRRSRAPNIRFAWALGSTARSGGRASRSRTSSRVTAVASHVLGLSRCGNRFISLSSSAPTMLVTRGTKLEPTRVAVLVMRHPGRRGWTRSRGCRTARQQAQDSPRVASPDGRDGRGRL